MKPFETAIFSAPGAGTTVNGFGPHRIRISSADTAGRLGVFEAEVPTGEGPPPHVHHREDEFFRVLEGRFAFWCNGTRVDLDAGGVIVVPRGSVHRFQNIGTGAGKLMIVVTPGRLRRFLRRCRARAAREPAGNRRAGRPLRHVLRAGAVGTGARVTNGSAPGTELVPGAFKAADLGLPETEDPRISRFAQFAQTYG